MRPVNASPVFSKLRRDSDPLLLLAELQEIAGDDDFFRLNQVPKAWCKVRVLGTGMTAGNYAVQWVAHLRTVLAAECLRLGLKDLDVAVLQQGQPRRLTQLASLEVYKCGLNGIYYRSRYGHDLENWALFEPFDLQNLGNAESVRPDDADLMAACEIFGIVIEP